jgi:hypothetical protein
MKKWKRFRSVLASTLEEVLKVDDPDSPVYTFLKLRPPSLGKKDEEALKEKNKAAGN